MQKGNTAELKYSKRSWIITRFSSPQRLPSLVDVFESLLRVLTMSALRVTRLVHGDRWVVVMSNVKGIQAQSVLREEGDFPIDRVKKWMDEGKRITDVRFEPMCKSA